jgi:hypothetical protein
VQRRTTSELTASGTSGFVPVDQPSDRDDLVRLEKEQRQRGTLLGAAQREWLTLESQLERPEDTELRSVVPARHTHSKPRHGAHVNRLELSWS